VPSERATKHIQNMFFLTHGHLQSRPDEIAHEPFCSLLCMAHFDLVNIRISLGKTRQTKKHRHPDVVRTTLQTRLSGILVY
jgi:hypothetical protein